MFKIPKVGDVLLDHPWHAKKRQGRRLVVEYASEDVVMARSSNGGQLVTIQTANLDRFIREGDETPRPFPRHRRWWPGKTG